MSGAAALAATPPGRCLSGLTDFISMTIGSGGPVEHAGAPYCEKHAARSFSAASIEAPAAPDVIEADDRTYRVERRAGRSLGDKRVWTVVPVAGNAPARRSPVASTAAAAAIAPADVDPHPRAALGSADAE
jgi:hypothetical protein